MFMHDLEANVYYQLDQKKTRAVYLHIIHESVRLVDLRGPMLRVFILCFLAFILPVGIDVAYAAGIASDKESVLTVHPTTIRILLKLFICG